MMSSHSMWNLKYDTNEITYETEADSQTERTDLQLPQEEGRGGTDWELAISKCKNYYMWNGKTIRNYCISTIFSIP